MLVLAPITTCVYIGRPGEHIPLPAPPLIHPHLPHVINQNRHSRSLAGERLLTTVPVPISETSWPQRARAREKPAPPPCLSPPRSAPEVADTIISADFARAVWPSVYTYQKSLESLRRRRSSRDADPTTILTPVEAGRSGPANFSPADPP
ncbi:hypothetical protein CDD83_7147 [Cordyceps sp. RAO-2017]|nr:hypothetical protein CDD83_7147 [Cordyceps sp. RAO-2017]